MKTPGGNTTVHYKKRKPSAHKCQICGNKLHGTLRERPYKMKSIPKTMKRPERPFGGVLCSRCSRTVIREEAKTE